MDLLKFFFFSAAQLIEKVLPTDPFLPRVCELAVSSSDRQSKVAACELLHAMVLFMIGKGAQPLQAQKVCFNKNVFSPPF